MTQIRYFNAFLLSSLTFVLLYVGYLSLPKKEKILKPAPAQAIKIALVTPPKKVIKAIVKPVVKKTPPAPLVKPKIPVVAKKVMPKKIIKKRVPKKKVVKKRVIKKKIIKKRVIKKIKPKKIIKRKKVIQAPIEEYIPIAPPVYVAPKPVVTPKPIQRYVAPPPVIKTSSTPQKSVKNDQYKKAFLRNIRSQILANKTYPRIAKRRHIEGSVKVRFDITADGQVSNIRFINGKSVFQKSIRKTLHNTFPLSIPANVKGELPLFDISVVLHFNIR